MNNESILVQEYLFSLFGGLFFIIKHIINEPIITIYLRTNMKNLNKKGIELKVTGTRNQCKGCSEYFNPQGVFDKHRAGSERFITGGKL